MWVFPPERLWIAYQTLKNDGTRQGTENWTRSMGWARRDARGNLESCFSALGDRTWTLTSTPHPNDIHVNKRFDLKVHVKPLPERRMQSNPTAHWFRYRPRLLR